ncbi:MAG TPA: hypothetical protein DCX08_04785 [Porticoccaceae bacterium]|jgi:hypothetical protein|nr:hypothetical protein [Porticoccaceae bacterium]
MGKVSELNAKQKGFQYQIWLMLVIVGGVILAGFLMVPNTEEQRQQMLSRLGTTNVGELVKPTLDFSSVLTDLDPTEKPKWIIATTGGSGCDATCEAMLFDTRQVHMLLGKSTRRVERVYLYDVENTTPDQIETIKQVHPFLAIIPVISSELLAILGGSSAQWDMQTPRHFVISPDQKAILYYTADHDGNGLLDDLKHLLKYSPDR